MTLNARLFHLLRQQLNSDCPAGRSQGRDADRTGSVAGVRRCCPVRGAAGGPHPAVRLPNALVTTEQFGTSAQEFAAGKPLTLIGGTQLVDLLARYGVGQYTVQ